MSSSQFNHPIKIPKHREALSVVDSSSLLEILKSFGIIVKTKVNFCGQKQDFEHQLKECFMDKQNYEPIIEGTNEDFRLENEFYNGSLYSTIYNDNSIYTKQSKIIIRFKCDFDHLNRIEKQSFNKANKSTRGDIFKKIVKTDRKNANMIRIEFDLKFNSITEIVKYLNLSSSKIILENEILSRLVDVLDVDPEKKQVYIKLKTFDSCKTTNLTSYLLMGKIDGSNSCFMLDLTNLKHSYNLLTIDQIYRHFTPKKLKGRIYNKGNPSTFHDCKEIGVHRVLIGCFFVCMTDTLAGIYTKREKLRVIESSTFSPDIVDTKKTTSTFEMIAEHTTTFDYFYYDHSYYGGIIDTGYYKFELKSPCRFYCDYGDLKFRREFYHFSL